MVEKVKNVSLSKKVKYLGFDVFEWRREIEFPITTFKFIKGFDKVKFIRAQGFMMWSLLIIVRQCNIYRSIAAPCYLLPKHNVTTQKTRVMYRFQEK